MTPQTLIHIAIPVRNEEELLSAALESLADQRYEAGGRVPWQRYAVLLLANNCTDGSVGVARRFAETHPGFRLRVKEVTLPPERAHAGWARRLAMDGACEADGECELLATTDADSRVSPFWIAATLREFAAGADAVCGRIRLDDVLDGAGGRRHDVDEQYRLLVARMEDLLDPLEHDPWPRHHQHYGASFAVRREAYRLAGGVPPVSGLEDVAFYEALLAVDARVRHSPDVQVTTSARRHGRAAIGLSAQLRDWEDADQPALVECADFTARLFAVRREMRKRTPGDARLDGYFGATFRDLHIRQRLAERWPGGIWRDAASQIPKLERMLRSLERGALQAGALENVKPVLFPALTAPMNELASLQE